MSILKELARESGYLFDEGTDVLYGEKNRYKFAVQALA